MSITKTTLLAALCGGLMISCAADLEDADQALGEEAEEQLGATEQALDLNGFADLLVTNTNLPYFGAMRRQVLTVGATTRNQGTYPTAGFTTGFYLSTDAVKSNNDIFLGRLAYGGLAGNAQVTGTLNVTVPGTLPNGEYRLIACANDDGRVGDVNPSNNCKASSNTVLVLF